MKLSPVLEEILEALWVKIVQDKKENCEISFFRDNASINELSNLNLIKITNGVITLTEKGRKIGQGVVRRHRLAERLFADVLDFKKGKIHSISCEFEHLLHEGIEDNICILLGHPKTCPHGSIIPPGRCCIEATKTAKKVVSNLSDLDVGDKGKIAYIRTSGNRHLPKIMAMGALPGVSIKLLQKFPSYIFQITNSQFAVDKSIADEIFIRIEK